MNSSNNPSRGGSFSRRSFVKTSAFSASAIALLSQGIALASETGTSSYWDMNCAAPNSSGAKVQMSNSATIGTTSFTATLVLKTAKTQDNAHVNSDSATHTAEVTVGGGGTTRTLKVTNAYNITCPRDTGVITSTVDSANSTPATHVDTANFTVGTYNVQIGLTSVPIAHGGATVTTTASFSGTYQNSANPNDYGSFSIPSSGNLPTISNTFSPHQH